MSRAILSDRIATAVLWGIGGLVILILGAIVVHFALASIGTVSLSFLVSDPSDTEIGGIGPLLWNSIYMLVLTLLITVPFGVAGGIWLSEYAGPGRLTSAIRFAQELISSVPSIVVGLFGLALFVKTAGWGLSALAGAFALSVFNLPLMARLTEQALKGVPADERTASLALGVSRWDTIRRVVLPLAIPGIVTGIVLTAGRIFGEAAVLIFTAGMSSPTGYDFGNLNLTDPRSPWSPFHSATTLSVEIWKLNSEALSKYRREIADAASFVLVVMVLIFNLGARGLGRMLQRRVTGA